MQYGSGEYEYSRNYVSSPVSRVRPEAAPIADKHRGFGMHACLNQPTVSSFGGNVNMDAGPMRYVGVKSPILVDPVYNGGKYSNRSARPVPRVRPEAEEVAEKSKGCVGRLFANYGKPDPYSAYDTRDENIDPRNGPLRKAGVRSPILVDPVYQTGDYSGRTPRPAPRVKPEANEIATKSMGTVGKLFTTQERRYDEYTKPKKQPKDHTVENVRRMRQIQRESRAKEREKIQTKNPSPVKALWKSSQYNTVESKVKEFMQDPPKAPRTIHDKLERPHSAPPRSSGDMSHHTNTGALKPRKSTTPRHATGKINFVSRNAQLARSYELGRSRSELAMYESQAKYSDDLDTYNLNVKGKTPSYLRSRQKLWEKQERERVRNMPDPTVPEGHSVMPEKERQNTLATLKQTVTSRIFEKQEKTTKSMYLSRSTCENGLVARHHNPFSSITQTIYYDDQSAEQWANVSGSSIYAERPGDGKLKFSPQPPSYDRPTKTNNYVELIGSQKDYDYYDVKNDDCELMYSNNTRKPCVNISAKYGSPVYVYAPRKVTNVVPMTQKYTQNSYEEPVYTSRKGTYYDDTILNGSVQAWETETDPLARKYVTFEDEQNTSFPSFHKLEPALMFADQARCPPEQYRVKTTYRDSFGLNEEHNKNYWRDTDSSQYVQPTLWEYETGRRSWSDGSLRLMKQ
ncbi:uncharacterized protein LOC143464936 isoform X2 [Clavelina lepadiformis]|uniref:uncharacterized protein LOC143464936 isoform X2 n=1 Tax=Clavelina lepadiformis TaxID=159417 RepID=UPI004042B39B